MGTDVEFVFDDVAPPNKEDRPRNDVEDADTKGSDEICPRFESLTIRTRRPLDVETKKRFGFTHTTDSHISSDASVGRTLHSLSGALDMFDQHLTCGCCLLLKMNTHTHTHTKKDKNELTYPFADTASACSL